MKSRQFRLVAMDMDDTFLCRDKSISTANMQAVKDAISSGITIVPASGRAFSMLPREIRNCPGIRYFITANGARVRDFQDNRYLYSNLILYDTVLSLLDLEEAYGLIPEVCLEEVFYISEADEDNECCFYDPSLAWFVRSMHTKVPSLREEVLHRRIGSEKMLAFFPDVSKMDAFRLEAEDRFHVTVSTSVPGEFEITASGVSKGTALMALCEKLGIDRRETLAMGDSGNDEAMLRSAGFSVAMGNSDDSLISFSDFITDDCDNDGFAKAIYRFVL